MDRSGETSTERFMREMSESRRETKADEIDMDRYLAMVNRPYVKSFTSGGEIFDCVRIEDQLGFDPIRDDHIMKQIQMSESEKQETELFEMVLEDGEPSEEGSPNFNRIPRLRDDDDCCPKGTVPIRRITKAALRLDPSQKHSDYGFSRLRHFENVIAYENNQAGYIGARAIFNVWQPSVERSTEKSQMVLFIYNIFGSEHNQIKVGWHVYPDMYNGDYRPRLFIPTINYIYKPRYGCRQEKQYGGFVQINDGIKIGEPIQPVSSYNGKQFAIPIEIYKDPNSYWWLKVSEVTVGYWPPTLLPRLSDGACGIQWGGLVGSDIIDGQHTATHMGSGRFPVEGFRKASYVRNMEVIYQNERDWRPPENLNFTVANSNHYDMKAGQFGSWGTHFFYGGSGRNSSSPVRNDGKYVCQP